MFNQGYWIVNSVKWWSLADEFQRLQEEDPQVFIVLLHTLQWENPSVKSTYAVKKYKKCTRKSAAFREEEEEETDCPVNSKPRYKHDVVDGQHFSSPIAYRKLFSNLPFWLWQGMGVVGWLYWLRVQLGQDGHKSNELLPLLCTT